MSRLLLLDPIPGLPSTAPRAERFLQRIDDLLPTLQSDAARRSFLARQIARWESLYQGFILSEGASEPVTNPKDPPQAVDFLLTITGLAARGKALSP